MADCCPSCGTSTVYAPMACVMPPASPAATLAFRTKSSSDVCSQRVQKLGPGLFSGLFFN